MLGQQQWLLEFFPSGVLGLFFFFLFFFSPFFFILVIQATECQASLDLLQEPPAFLAVTPLLSFLTERKGGGKNSKAKLRSQFTLVPFIPGRVQCRSHFSSNAGHRHVAGGSGVLPPCPRAACSGQLNSGCTRQET